MDEGENLRRFEEAVSAAGPELRDALSDRSIEHVVLDGDRGWARPRGSGAPRPLAIKGAGLTALAALGPAARAGGWQIETLRGLSGSIVVLERSGEPSLPFLDPELARAMRQRAPGRGLVVGPAGSGTLAALLWIAGELAGLTGLFISDLPAAPLPPSFLHAWTPSTRAEAGAIDRLAKRMDAVLWHGRADPDSWRTVFGTPGAGARWLATDAPQRLSAIEAAAWHAARCGTKFPECVLYNPAAALPARMLTSRDEGWSASDGDHDAERALADALADREVEARVVGQKTDALAPASPQSAIEDRGSGMPAAADMPGADAPEEDGLADDALPPFVRDASGPGRRSARPLVLEELKQIERDLHAAGDHALSGDDERTGRLPEPGASEALTSLDQAAHGGEEEEIDVDAVLESLRSSSEVSAPDDLIEGARAAHSPLAWHEDEETADRATPRAPQRESFSTEKLSRPKAGGSTTERLGALSARLKAMRERRRSDQQSEIECDDES